MTNPARQLVMRPYFLHLTISNALVYLSAGISYFFCSRLLTAAEFGTYSAALALGNIATIALDGSVRTSIIKRGTKLVSRDEAQLLRLLVLASALLMAASAVVGWGLSGLYPEKTGDFLFIVGFSLVYLATYPWITLPTARLEQDFRYSRIAWIEGLSIVCERALPLPFVYMFPSSLLPFLYCLIGARLLRATLLRRSHAVPVLLFPGPTTASVREVVRDGLWYQAGASSFFLRDNLHLILVGPLFGANWVGYYAWCLQLCVMASQVFVQLFARISLPIAAQEPAIEKRWYALLGQIRQLTAITTPLLAVTLIGVPLLDDLVFDGKWARAIPLLPFLFLRMIPGLACAPAASLLLVNRGARKYSLTLWSWTAIEVIAAIVGIALSGPMGWAQSGALGAWAGLLLIVVALGHVDGRKLNELVFAILTTPNLLLSVTCCAIYLKFGGLLDALPETTRVLYTAAYGAAVLLCALLLYSRRLTPSWGSRAVMERKGDKN